ncbi:autophagy-related protein 2 homolog A [Schistocerca nitens]|uniref:autophagy-related protein 2 homolog A n=1 Tax=Schistocerca nitens TaxID=7011 RepID=UPI0021173742|nr:autophagy-related protein 2 homolog A [Schistocerca nitens]
MPWYESWSESIKKRACRYLLQRYLGQFLEEKLTLDQLTVDLYNGTGTVCDVRLDVQALNELGEQQNLPVEFVDGFVEQMSVSIPWSSLLSSSSYVEVSGLVLTIQPKQRADSGTSMFESMWSSMTSSMQLAEECLKQASPDGKSTDEAQPLEGLELFAQTIDSILSRVKVKFLSTVIRLEHVPKESSSGVALEIRIKNMDYCDEAGTDPPTPPMGDTQLQQANKLYQVAAFTTKKFYLEGVSLYTDEFPSQARTFSRSVMSSSTGSTPESKNSDYNFGTAPVTPSSSSPVSPLQTIPPAVAADDHTQHRNLSVEPDPVLFAKLAGRQELRVKLKQAEGVPGPKVDLELTLGSLSLFISPRQFHVLLELLHGLSTPDLEDTSNVAPRSRCVEKPMDPADFHRVEQELQQQLHPQSSLGDKGLQHTQGWSTASLDDSDEEFLPMRGTAMTESMLSDAGSMDTSLSSSVSSTSSASKSTSVSSPTRRLAGFGGSHGTQSPSFQQNVSSRPKKKSHKGSVTSTLESDPSAEVSHFHIRMSSLAVVLLHEDVLTVCVDSDGSMLARSSVQQMKTIANDFFSELGLFAVSGYGRKDFKEARDVFLKACQLNHIRLLAAPVIIEGNERTTTQASSVAGTLTTASLEVLECLIDKKTPSQRANVEYVELLRFLRCTDAEEGQNTFPLHSQPDLKLVFKYTEKAINHGQLRHYTHPRTDLKFTLEKCASEIDISIVDRITAVLNPQPLCRRSTSKYGMGSGAVKDLMTQQTCFYQAVESSSLADSKTEIKVSSSLLKMNLRFPTPDLRPIHDMDRPPWWKRSVRKDILIFELEDVSFHTMITSRDPTIRYEFQCRDVKGLFQEADTDVSLPFLRASCDDRNGNSLPDGGKGFGWPRIVIAVYPVNSPGDLDDIGENEVLEDSMPHSTFEPLEKATSKEPSPFSSKKVIHESDTPHGRSVNHAEGDGEELVIPGDKHEMAEFIEHASRNCRVQLEINLPCASMQISSKHLYELIYNRINTDMFLWEPSAPKPSHTDLYSGKGSGGADLSSALLQDQTYPTFSLCKSGIQYDSDTDSEENEGIYYSVYEHRQRQKRRQQTEGASLSGQSLVAVTLSVSQGILNVFAPVRDSSGNVIPGQHGELEIHFEDGNMFSVSGYRGKTGLGYVCLQVNQATFYHSGLVRTPTIAPPLRMYGSPPPSHLDLTIYKSEGEALVNHSAAGGDMLTMAIKIQLDDSILNLKTFRVAAGLRGATLRHRMCASSTSWFTQFVDFFDVRDYPVAGYDPPGVITELHMHLWDCAVDYRPLYLPLKSMITVGSFSISSNIAAQTSTSTLRFIAEDSALYISNKTSLNQQQQNSPVDLRNDYVCVLDMGLFELSLRLSDKGSGGPRIDLRASNNMLHIHTCADTAKALAELLTYFASDGDLRPVGTETDVETGPESIIVQNHSNADQVLINTGDLTTTRQEPGSDTLSKSQVAHVHNMMEEAMRETLSPDTGLKSRSPRSQRNKKDVEVFFFPDENQPIPIKPSGDSELSQEEDDNWEDEFCILDKEAGSGFLPRNGLPEVRMLIQEPVRIIDNHFSVPLGKTDLLKAPKHFPAAVLRYTLREMSVVWHMYGGQDFAVPDSSQTIKKQVKIDEHYRVECKSCPSSPPFTTHHVVRSPSEIRLGVTGSGVSFSKASPTEVKFISKTPVLGSPKSSPHMTWQTRGGPGRRHDVLMELQLNKVRFQHEVYPDTTTEASRQVLLINELELRDRLASSQINKFLYQYSSETRPKQSHANMVVVKAVHLRPDPKLKVQECCLKVSVLPLKLNIDQDSLVFLFNFFTDISGGVKIEDDGSQGHTPRHSTPTHQAPVMTVNVEGSSAEPKPEPQAPLIQLEDEPGRYLSEKVVSVNPSFAIDDRPPPPPIFFRSFTFTPEVPIRLDYHGKHVDMTHGPLAGLLMGLGQLNSSELRLKRISYRHGLLGFDKLLAFVLSEWLQDIKKNQLPSLLGGVGPMHALVQLFQGIRDLFWLPIEQYQKDGRIVRGLQRGANSFTTSTAMAALELTNRIVQAIQSTAEMAYDMLSPGPSVRRRHKGTKGKRKRYSQPADIREGMANAIVLVREGLGETAQNIVRVASEEHEQKGMSGAVGGVLRQIPPTVVKPIILVTEATANVLGGMRSQLAPDARKEAVEKWRSDD